MQLPFSLNNFKRFIAVVGSWYVIAASYLNFNHFTGTYRDVLAAAGAVILSVEHATSVPETPGLSTATPTSSTSITTTTTATPPTLP